MWFEVTFETQQVGGSWQHYQPTMNQELIKFIQCLLNNSVINIRNAVAGKPKTCGWYFKTWISLSITPCIFSMKDDCIMLLIWTSLSGELSEPSEVCIYHVPELQTVSPEMVFPGQCCLLLSADRRSAALSWHVTELARLHPMHRIVQPLLFCCDVTLLSII